jgi:hypothetical protein
MKIVDARMGIPSFSEDDFLGTSSAKNSVLGDGGVLLYCSQKERE